MAIANDADLIALGVRVYDVFTSYKKYRIYDPSSATCSDDFKLVRDRKMLLLAATIAGNDYFPGVYGYSFAKALKFIVANPTFTCNTSMDDVVEALKKAVPKKKPRIPGNPVVVPPVDAPPAEDQDEAAQPIPEDEEVTEILPPLEVIRNIEADHDDPTLDVSHSRRKKPDEVTARDLRISMHAYMFQFVWNPRNRTMVRLNKLVANEHESSEFRKEVQDATSIRAPENHTDRSQSGDADPNPFGFRAWLLSDVPDALRGFLVEYTAALRGVQAGEEGEADRAGIIKEFQAMPGPMIVQYFDAQTDEPGYFGSGETTEQIKTAAERRVAEFIRDRESARTLYKDPILVPPGLCMVITENDVRKFITVPREVHRAWFGCNRSIFLGWNLFKSNCIVSWEWGRILGSNDEYIVASTRSTCSSTTQYSTQLRVSSSYSHVSGRLFEDIVRSHCTCISGLGLCKHIAAVALKYTVFSAWANKERTTTEQLCRWIIPKSTGSHMTPSQAMNMRMKRVPIAVKFAETEAIDTYERCVLKSPRRTAADSKATWKRLIEERKMHDAETANKSRREMKPNAESSEMRKQRETKKQKR